MFGFAVNLFRSVESCRISVYPIRVTFVDARCECIKILMMFIAVNRRGVGGRGALVFVLLLYRKWFRLNIFHSISVLVKVRPGRCTLLRWYVGAVIVESTHAHGFVAERHVCVQIPKVHKTACNQLSVSESEMLGKLSLACGGRKRKRAQWCQRTHVYPGYSWMRWHNVVVDIVLCCCCTASLICTWDTLHNEGTHGWHRYIVCIFCLIFYLMW